MTLEGVATIRRTLWAVELPAQPEQTSGLPVTTLTGGPETYGACRDEARRLRARGAVGLVAPSAALLDGAAHGWKVDGRVQPGAPATAA